MDSEAEYKISRTELSQLVSIDRIQSALHFSDRCLTSEQENFVGNPTHCIYEQISTVLRESWALLLTLLDLKHQLLEKSKLKKEKEHGH